jgi:hypothetical protein
MMTRTILLLAAALAANGCAARARPPAQPNSSAPPPPASADNAKELRHVLERAISDRAGWDTLRLLVDCRRGDAMTSLTVFGSGVGIWSEERQFTLDAGHISGLLRALQAADFPGMEDTYGGAPRPGRPSTGHGALVTIATCRIELSLGGHHKQVVQLAQGEQSPKLKKLADDLLDICKAPARLGLTATGLRDGLEKVSRGDLEPETLLLVVHRKPQDKSGGDRPGFLLRVSGYQVTTRAYHPATGYQDPVSLHIEAKEVRTLARELAARDPAAWPVNLYAAEYTDLSIQVLNHEKAIQARQFAALERTTHGRQQKDFEEAFEILERLHRRVLERGGSSGLAAPRP